LKARDESNSHLAIAPTVWQSYPPASRPAHHSRKLPHA
jgi:hypothetical protein